MDYEDAGDDQFRETVNIMDLSLARAPEPAGTNGEVWRAEQPSSPERSLPAMLYSRSTQCAFLISCLLRRRSLTRKPTLHPHTLLLLPRSAGAMTRTAIPFSSRIRELSGGRMVR